MATPQPGVWGIDLGQCALKAIRLQEIDGEVKATAFDYIEHPKILSQPDADPDQLTREALEQFLSRNKLKGDIVVVSVPGQTGLARFVKLPPVEEKKIADIVKFEAKQQIPFPLEEVVWDFQKIGSGEVTDGFALETEIGLFAMKRDMVNRAIQQFKDVGVEVHIVQMAPLALANLVTYEFLGKGAEEGGEAAAETGCIVALEIGADNSNLIITDGGKIIWQRPIPLGGNHFTRALTKDLKLTFAKAEHLKRNAIKSPDLKKILASLKTVLNDFVGEVQRSLGYFTNTHRGARIEYMLGLGNAFRLPGLQKYLQEKLQIEVRKPGELSRMSGDEVLAAPQFTENILTFGVAIGLAARPHQGEIHTNLLPHEIRVERLVRAKKPWAAAAVAALVLAIAGITFASSMELSAVKNDAIAARMKAADDEVKKANQLDSDFKAEEQKLEDSKLSIKRISAGVDERFNWGLFYQYINLSLPTPDGSNLVDKSRFGRNVQRDYINDKSRKALQLLEERRFASGDPKKAKKLDELQKEEKEIKEHLIQINIEGVTPLYTEDLPAFFAAIPKENTFRGMEESEQVFAKDMRSGKKREELDEAGKRIVPEKCWVVEIRGYTYHQQQAEFVEDTILEKLARLATKPPKELQRILQKTIKTEGKDEVQDRVHFLFLYDIRTITEPQQGQFAIIGSSSLRGLIGGDKGAAGGAGGAPPRGSGSGPGAGPIGGGPMGGMPPMGMGGGPPPGMGGKDDGKGAAPDRSQWQAIGQIAASADKGGGAGGGVAPDVGKGGFRPPGPMGGDKKGAAETKKEVVPRTEFIIFLVWDEPVLEFTATPKD
ncbi:MAG: type IV pilus assembly protein PilM [Gemmataceae bacterium]